MLLPGGMGGMGGMVPMGMFPGGMGGVMMQPRFR